jgi:hypothetical protein
VIRVSPLDTFTRRISLDLRRLVAVGFVVALALCATVEGRANTEGVHANVAVTDGRFAESGEPALAVNPRDPRNLLGATQDINPQPGPAPGSFASFDGGKTWSDGGLLPLPAGDHVGGDVTVAFNGRGTGFVLSHAGPGGFNVNRFTRKASQAGWRFHNPASASTA